MEKEIGLSGLGEERRRVGVQRIAVNKGKGSEAANSHLQPQNIAAWWQEKGMFPSTCLMLKTSSNFILKTHHNLYLYVLLGDELTTNPRR